MKLGILLLLYYVKGTHYHGRTGKYNKIFSKIKTKACGVTQKWKFKAIKCWMLSAMVR